MYSLPTSVLINGTEYAIRNKGDYRLVLDCFLALDDEQITKQERVLACLVIFYEVFDGVEDLYKINDLTPFIKEMYNFFNCGQESIGQQMPYKLMDWKRDETLLISAINTAINQEVRAVEYMHWWTFMGYYLGIGECTFSHIINIRNKVARHEKLEKYERKFKQENPQYFNWDNRLIDQREADELAHELWNKE